MSKKTNKQIKDYFFYLCVKYSQYITKNYNFNQKWWGQWWMVGSGRESI